MDLAGNRGAGGLSGEGLHFGDSRPVQTPYFT